MTTEAAKRSFTQFAASILGPDHSKALDEGRCVVCLNPIGEFRNNLSEKEFNISGMCQDCQDKTFGED